MNIETIVVLIMVAHLQSTVKKSDNYIKWKNIFKGLFFIVLGVICLDVMLKSEPYTRWVIFGEILFIIYIAYKNKEFRKSRIVIFSVIPLLAIKLIAEIVRITVPNLFEEYDTYFATATSFSFIWIVAMLVMSNRQKKAQEKEDLRRKIEEEHKKALELKKIQLEHQVSERTTELIRQKEELQQTLSELKATQTQLIHHEKMASLGELTAGIAHEIQNPLNFVNNFSEVSMELLDEMEEELANNNPEEVIAISKDIRQNLGKIAQHGKRADSIVKGMLQHSRTTSGNKELADINVIADEYLRLSYHGLRAKDKSFNASMNTDFEENIRMVNMVAQDVGRVLLNLFNNSFYSVMDKKKLGIDGYEPTVSVSTKNMEEGIEIKVRDNGMGISEEALKKIYQPFFTTKPTGEGTGLGLSMSYDIITKGHGGTLKVDTVKGEFAEFTILLPS